MTSSTIDALFELYGRSAEAFHTERLRQDFRQVLEIFVAANYPRGMEENTLMCSIHDAFPSHHRCVACNLQGNVSLIERFLLQTGNIVDVHFAFTTFLLLLYLVTERMQVYLEIAELPDSYRHKHFGVIQEVRHWANFLKHPKWFMLVLHPRWEYEGAYPCSVADATTQRVTINTAFVKKYYRHDANNNELDKLLARNEDVVVLFPNPVELMTRFAAAQKKFVQAINENEYVRESLEAKTKGRHQPAPIVEEGKRRSSRPS